MARRRRRTDVRRGPRQRTVAEGDMTRFRRAFEKQYPILRGRETLIKRLFEPTTSEHLHSIEVLELQRAALLMESDKTDLTADHIEAISAAVGAIDTELSGMRRPGHPLRRRTP